eukprot:4225193-Amphidinium_carterae.1
MARGPSNPRPPAIAPWDAAPNPRAAAPYWDAEVYGTAERARSTVSRVAWRRQPLRSRYSNRCERR